MKMIAVLVGALLASTPAWAKFDTAAWLQSPNQGANWSRTALLSVLPPSLKGMTRAQVLALLGEPGRSGQTVFALRWPFSGIRVDEYRLSASNEEELIVWYNSTDTATASDAHAKLACDCPECREIESSLTTDLAKVSTLPSNIRVHTQKELVAHFGRGRQFLATRVDKDNLYWMAYSVWWHVAGHPHMFLDFNGEAPFENLFAVEKPDKLDPFDLQYVYEHAPITRGTTIRYYPDCLPPLEGATQ